jgi:hypothetical protein
MHCALEPLPSAFPLSDVAQNFGEPDELAVIVLEGRDHSAGAKARPAFSQMPTLVLSAAVIQCKLELVSGCLATRSSGVKNSSALAPKI